MDLMKKSTLNNLKKYILDIFFPNRCPFCGRIIKWNENCCEKCIKEIPYITSTTCLKCGKENCICNDVRINYDGCVSVAYYEGIIKKGILGLKIEKAFNLIDVFEKEIDQKISEMIPFGEIDFVTSVPMHKSVKRTRGYNQSDIIAKKASEIIKKPAVFDVLIKTEKDIVQHNLAGSERKQAVKGLYRINSKCAGEVSGKTILLCDDIITTGSTLNECAKALKKSGAKAVYCFTVASTKLFDDK